MGKYGINMADQLLKVRENVQRLDEALSPQDKKVVDAFYFTDKPMTGKILKTDGKTLEKTGMGAQTIAKVIPQSGGKFKVVAKMDGRSTQEIVNYIKKTFPKQLVTYEEVELDEGRMKELAMKIAQVYSNMKKDKNMRSFADKFRKDVAKSLDIRKSLEKVLPDYVAGKDITNIMSKHVPGHKEEGLDENKDVRKKYKGKEQKAVNMMIMRNGIDGVQKLHDKDPKKFDATVKRMSKSIKEEVELDEKVSYVEYKFKNARDAGAAKKYFDAQQRMSFDVNDDNIRGGELMVDAGKNDMTQFHKEVMKKFRPKVMSTEAKLIDKPTGEVLKTGSKEEMETERKRNRDELQVKEWFKSKNIDVKVRQLDESTQVYVPLGRRIPNEIREELITTQYGKMPEDVKNVKDINYGNFVENSITMNNDFWSKVLHGTKGE